MSMNINLSGSGDNWGDVSISLHFPAHPAGNLQLQDFLDEDPFDIDGASPSTRASGRGRDDGVEGDDGTDNGLLRQLMMIIYLLGLSDRGGEDDAPVEEKGSGKGKGGGSGSGGACGGGAGVPDRFNGDWDTKSSPSDPGAPHKRPSGKTRPDGETGKDDPPRTETEKNNNGNRTETENNNNGNRTETEKNNNGNRTETSGKTTKGSGPGAMPEPTGTVNVNETIVVKAGETFDGGGKLYKAGASLGDGGQSEGQKPIFQIEPGGKLKNLQYEGADGIHTMGDATIEDVWARDVGEDAMTMKKPGNVTWSGGGAFNAHDKIFQLNAGGSFTLENFTADNFGKAVRTNGGKQIDTDIVIRNSHFSNGDEAIVRTDSTSASITLEGVTFSNVPNDVLAPGGTEVVGAVKRGSK